MAPADTRKRDPVTTEHVKDAFVPLPEKVKKESEAVLSPYRAPLRLPDVYPSVSQVTAVIPPHCFVKSYFWSFYYAIFSGTLTFLTAFLAWKFLPEPSLSPISLLAWAIYAYANGAIATGMWVVAHECGHGAFCENKIIQDCVGFIYHSLLLVPYYSWQRSHAIHHSRTNHITEGESHVPFIHTKSSKTSYVREFLGDDAFAIFRVIQHLVFGWPAYLLFGITGGSVRGVTNHFIPYSDLLYPGMWKLKVLLSDVGVGLVIYGLYLWGQYAGSATVLALYVAPYLVVNCWLVAYTWLQHTDVDVPHYDERKWTWIKGAFATIDRPYPEPFDTLHHRIGSTHVAHHLYHRIPHYHAREATNAIKTAFPEYYIYDPTPLTTALFRIAAQCPAVEPLGDGRYFFTVRPTEQ